MKPAKPFFRSLPEWVYDDPEYESLSAGEAWFLHLVAGQCDETMPDKSMRGCRVGQRLLDTAKVDRATTYRYLKRFRKLGFVVKLGQGGGRTRGGGGLANEYAIPSKPGALDHIDVGDDPAFKTRKRSQRATVEKPGPPADTVAPCEGKPSQPATNTVAPCNNNARRLRASHTYSSSSNTSEHKASNAKFIQDDDDQALQVEPVLADDASEEQVVKALTDRGVHRRRSKRLATQATPAQVNEAITRCSGYDASNPGAYLADTVLDLVDQAEAARAREAAELSARIGEELKRYETLIDTLDDEQLAAVFARYCERTSWPRTDDYTPEFIRARPGTRKQVTQQLLHEASEVEPDEFPNASDDDKADQPEPVGAGVGSAGTFSEGRE